MWKATKRVVRESLRYLCLPWEARVELHRDGFGLPKPDPGPSRVVEEGVQWLCRAQDSSVPNDGGVARHYSLLSGWSDSYPETTGYVIPTMLSYANIHQDNSVRNRARRMLDWLVSIQFPEGGFQGGTVGGSPRVPVVFNTGQILLGLASGAREFGEAYRPAMCRAADWLVKVQDADGCWRRHPSPFADPGEKTYDVHAAWGLLDAARVDGNDTHAKSALANVDWALSRRRSNGWFEQCCLTNPNAPLTHTIGYTLRGILEAFLYSRDDRYLHASRQLADALLGVITRNGFLPGRLDEKWQAAAPWSCLTGTAQIACCWLILYQVTQETKYLEAALAANQYVRRTIKVTTGPINTRGGVKGSFPVNGKYGTYQFLNWACKFAVDANMCELEIAG